MKNNLMPEARKKWIEAGYGLFAKEGPEGIQIEKLARILNLNKSGFYHYFGDREVFFLKLIEYHDKSGEQIFQEMSLLQQFDPDYFELCVKYKTSLLVQMQLRKHSVIPLFKEGFIKFAKRNDKVQIPLWASYLNISDNQDLATKLWIIARDAFYTRLSDENMDVDFLRSLLTDIVTVAQQIMPKGLMHNVPPIT